MTNLQLCTLTNKQKHREAQTSRLESKSERPYHQVQGGRLKHALGLTPLASPGSVEGWHFSHHRVGGWHWGLEDKRSASMGTAWRGGQLGGMAYPIQTPPWEPLNTFPPFTSQTHEDICGLCLHRKRFLHNGNPDRNSLRGGAGFNLKRV